MYIYISAYNITVSEPAEHAHMGMAVKCILLPHMMRCDRTKEGQGNEKLAFTWESEETARGLALRFLLHPASCPKVALGMYGEINFNFLKD